MVSAGERRSAADVLAKAKAKTERVRLLLDPDLADEHARLDAELGDADDQHAAAEAVLKVEEQIAEAEVEFTFRGIGRGRWRKLMADYPASEDQRKQGAEFDPDVFPFVAMAECLLEPRMTVDDLEQLHDEALSEVQFSQLWTACLKANLGSGGSRPESLAARAILASVDGKSKQLSDSGLAEAS